MSKMTRFAKGFYKNVILRHKYKAFLLVIFSSQYRRDLNRLYLLTKGCTRSDLRPIHMDNIVHGHQIVYPGYALSLFSIASSLPPIRVVFDQTQHKFVVVDGNHRLPALKMAFNGEFIECEVMS